MIRTMLISVVAAVVSVSTCFAQQPDPWDVTARVVKSYALNGTAVDSCFSALRARARPDSASDLGYFNRMMDDSTGAEACDKYMEYFTPEEAEALNERLGSGKYEGIGTQISARDSSILLFPFPGSPAAKAGVMPFDVLTHVINGTDTVDVRPAGKADEKDTKRVVDNVRGVGGTQVTLILERRGNRVSVTVTRGTVRMATVMTAQLGPGIGYIDLRLFSAGAPADLKNALDSLASKSKYIVLDLRGNPGGSLGAAEQMMQLFSPDPNAIMITTKYRDSSVVTRAGVVGQYRDTKFIILVNGGTASAAEILAGTLLDWGNAVAIVGEPTYGKDVGQSVFRLCLLGLGGKQNTCPLFKLTTFYWAYGNSQASVGNGHPIVPTDSVSGKLTQQEEQQLGQEIKAHDPNKPFLSRLDRQLQRAIEIANDLMKKNP